MKVSKVSPRCHSGLTSLTLGAFRRSGEGCHRVSQGVKNHPLSRGPLAPLVCALCVLGGEQVQPIPCSCGPFISKGRPSLPSPCTNAVACYNPPTLHPAGMEACGR